MSLMEALLSDAKFAATLLLSIAATIFLPAIYGWPILWFVAPYILMVAILLREISLLGDEMFPDESRKNYKREPISKLPLNATEARIAAIAGFLEDHCPRLYKAAASWGNAWSRYAKPMDREDLIHTDGSIGWSPAEINLEGIAYLKREIIMLRQLVAMLEEIAENYPPDQPWSRWADSIIPSHRQYSIDCMARHHQQIIDSASTVLRAELDLRLKHHKHVIRQKMGSVEFNETVVVKDPLPYRPPAELTSEKNA